MIKKKLGSLLLGGAPILVGIVNVTPDSFSDGGRYLSHDRAIEHGVKLVHEGAQILDIGGESTRPGAQQIDVKEEIGRILPVVKELAKVGAFISIDTRNSATMEVALGAGAHIINDISALSYDPRSVSVVADAGVPVVLMHSQGAPESMQVNPIYNNVVEDILQYLKERISFCEASRIDEDRIILDPGIGFGKTLEDNLLIIGNIKIFCDLGPPVLLGGSRKNFIAKISRDEPPQDRLPGSLATALWGLSQGVRFFRVHDVKETRQAFSVFQALEKI
ncbi:MAG: dihydropteroate synthase [Alphaproteobacteria bacterium]|nr:dihydropteroate synthase [Alphaproteobacteria bacterium]